MTKLLPTLLSLLALATSFAGRAQPAQWQRVKLDRLTSVEFPAAPTLRQGVGQQAQMLVDGPTTYMAITQRDVFRTGPSEAARGNFYEGVIKGTIEAAGGGELLSREPITVGGFAGVEATYTTPNRPKLSAVRRTRFVLINSTLHSLSFLTSPAQEEALRGSRDRFFNSLVSSVPPAAPPAAGLDARGAGRVAGRAVVYGLLGIGLLALVRRVRRKKPAA